MARRRKAGLRNLFSTALFGGAIIGAYILLTGKKPIKLHPEDSIVLEDGERIGYSTKSNISTLVTALRGEGIRVNMQENRWYWLVGEAKEVNSIIAGINESGLFKFNPNTNEIEKVY